MSGKCRKQLANSLARGLFEPTRQQFHTEKEQAQPPYRSENHVLDHIESLQNTRKTGGSPLRGSFSLFDLGGQAKKHVPPEQWWMLWSHIC
jgi:hypothetical protein